MSSLKLSIPHTLGQEDAAARVKNYFERLVAKKGDQVSNLQHTWVGDVLEASFSSMGFAVKGSVDVQPDAVVVNGTLPFAAMMFKGKIEQGIRDELSRVLS